MSIHRTKTFLVNSMRGWVAELVKAQQIEALKAEVHVQYVENSQITLRVKDPSDNGAPRYFTIRITENVQ